MEDSNAKPALRRVEIRDVFRRNKGAQRRLAEALGVTPSLVPIWLAGRTKSARVAAAAERMAVELLTAEEAKKTGERGS